MPKVESKAPRPTLDEECALLKQNYRVIAGVDEAGRGSIFGPVCVGMAVLPLHDLNTLSAALSQVRDSKQLHRPKVYRLADEIKIVARAWAVGHANAHEVDQFGIVGAIRRAAERALVQLEDRLGEKVDFLLTDSTMPTPTGFPPEQKRSMVRGDAHCLSIACAAMLAKCDHDARVRDLANSCAGDYGLVNNVGYGTAAHLSAIQRLGGTEHHRYSFRPFAHRPVFVDGAD